MTSLIQDYEQQYFVLTADITAQIGKLKITDVDEKRDLISKISTNVEEANELLEQLQLEIREAPINARPGLTNRLNCYQAELKRLLLEFTNAKSSKTAGYDSVDEFEDIGMQEDQKQRLLSNSERIERTGKTLEEGYRVIVETESLGNQVLQDLHMQRETITRARGRLRETDADLGRSSRIMNSMFMRSIREKAIIYGVGVVFILVVSLSIYFSFSK